MGIGFTTAMIGHLSVLSLAVVMVLFALGLEFAIAYVSSYLQLRRDGWQLRAALMEATAATGTASLTAAVTTASPFCARSWPTFRAWPSWELSPRRASCCVPWARILSCRP